MSGLASWVLQSVLIVGMAFSGVMALRNVLLGRKYEAFQYLELDYTRLCTEGRSEREIERELSRMIPIKDSLLRQKLQKAGFQESTALYEVTYRGDIDSLCTYWHSRSRRYALSKELRREVARHMRALEYAAPYFIYEIRVYRRMVVSDAENESGTD